MKPQVSFTTVFDQQRGLAVTSTGLLESAVRSIPQRPIALMLFRSTERAVFTNGEPGGQLIGDLEAEKPQDVALPSLFSMAAIEGDAIITSFRQVGAELEVRLFNPNSDSLTAVLSFAIPITEAHQMNFEGETIADVPVKDDTVSLTLPKKKIQTLRIRCRYGPHE